MIEKQAFREREAEPVESPYEKLLKWPAEHKAMMERSRIVIKGSQIPHLTGRQSTVRRYLHPMTPPSTWDTPLRTMGGPMFLLFSARGRTHSGKHTHQGGLGIFVLEGTGYTVCDGVRQDWKAGDLIMLPIKKGGVEHQHFNADPSGKPYRWLALIPTLVWDLVGPEVTQNEVNPEWKGREVAV